MKKIVLIISLVILAFNANAIDQISLLKEANTSYSKNDFDQALKQYQKILDSGYVSASLYYNMANTYYKSKNIKNAILFYERAKLLNPGDKDIDFNLGMARNSTVDKIEAMPEVFFITWIRTIQFKLVENSWAKISIFCFILSLMLFLIYLLSKSIFWKKFSFWISLLIFCFTICSFIFGYQLKEIQLAKNNAIIFTPSVSAKSSPSESGNNLFIIHEGTKVELLDHVGNWTEIKLADGSRGWVKTADFEII